MSNENRVRTLDLAPNCEDRNDWFLTDNQRKEIRNYLDDYSICDEDIDAICCALVQLGYAQGFKTKTLY